MDWKEHFLIAFKKHCLDFEWERKDSELKTEFGRYHVRCASTREGTFIQLIPNNSSLGPTIDAKDYILVKEIYSLVWNDINKKKEDAFWKDAIKELENIFLE